MCRHAGPGEINVDKAKQITVLAGPFGPSGAAPILPYI